MDSILACLLIINLGSIIILIYHHKPFSKSSIANLSTRITFVLFVPSGFRTFGISYRFWNYIHFGQKIPIIILIMNNPILNFIFLAKQFDRSIIESIINTYILNSFYRNNSMCSQMIWFLNWDIIAYGRKSQT